MSKVLNGWGFWGIAPLLGAIACSGTSVRDIGDINSGGHAGAAAGASTVGGSDDFGDAGDSAGAGRAPVKGGSGGTSSAGSAGAPAAGKSGSSHIESQAGDVGVAGDPGVDTTLVCPACVTVAAEQDVHSIAVDATRVVWVDFGTQDSLGNYNDDGRVLTRALAGGATSVLASSISGPEWVGLSPKYAYVFIDHGSLASDALGVVRVPLAGGAVEAVQTLPSTSYHPRVPFAAGGGSEYWAWGGAIYRISDADGATVETFVPARNARTLLSDETNLYFEDDAGEWSIPFTGGTPTLLAAGAPTQSSLLLSGDYIYALETPAHADDNTPVYVTRLPKAGGKWKRVTRYTSDVYFSQLAIDGDKYFFDQPTSGERERRLVQGSFADPESFQELASQGVAAKTWWGWTAWAWSPVGIFFANPEGLYLTPTK